MGAFAYLAENRTTVYRDVAQLNIRSITCVSHFGSGNVHTVGTAIHYKQGDAVTGAGITAGARCNDQFVCHVAIKHNGLAAVDGIAVTRSFRGSSFRLRALSQGSNNS